VDVLTDTDDNERGDIDPRITRCVKFVQRVGDNDSTNRVNAKYWRKFRYGEQWPPEIQNSRILESRPCITVNKTDTFCKQVENQQRQQRPRIKVDPTNGQATKKVADVIKGMVRHIESARGGADIAYDGGFAYALVEGVGYWRILADYTRPDSFEQELYLAQIEDPLSVYYDDNSVMPDGSDAEEAAIIADMNVEVFRAMYPDANDGANFQQADTDGTSDWITKETIRVAEYYYTKREKCVVVKLSNGETGYEDQLDAARMAAAGTRIVDKRPGMRKQIKWIKCTAMDVLEERDEPGQYLTIIPCYGEKAIIDGKRRRSGIVKNAVGPQQMSNFWKTAMTETVALAAKAKWLMAAGQDEGYENEWATANISAKATLHYLPVDVQGVPAEKPSRIQPEPPPEGAMAMAASVDADLTAVLGIVDPAMRIGGNVSGKALQAERVQSDVSTYNYFDNMTRSIAHTGRVILDLLPIYYSEPGRVVRIIGDDGQSTTDKINQPAEDDPQKIINDVTVGQYDVVMDAGPGYNTKRQEAREAMTPLFERDPELMKVAGDVYFRTMDYTGAETIADRLAAANPLSQIDTKSDVPPVVQMKLKQQDQMIKQLKESLQAAEMEKKYRLEGVRIKDEGDTKRTLIKSHADIHIEDRENEAWMHDVAVKSQTALGVAEINNAGKIITQDKDHKHDAQQFERVAQHEDSQLEKTAAQKPQ
jgi:hypothetical protein